MTTSLTAPIIQFEYQTDWGPVAGPPIAKPIDPIMVRELRETQRVDGIWYVGDDRIPARIIVLIEDPFGVEWRQQEGAL